MTMRRSRVFATLAAACALALAGCSQEIDHAGATAGASADAPASGSIGIASQRQLERPGVGLDGGLADAPVAGASAPGATMGAGPAAEGSTNTTTKSSVGNR